MERMIAAERMTRSQDNEEPRSLPNTPPVDPIEAGQLSAGATAFSPYASSSAPPPIEDDKLAFSLDQDMITGGVTGAVAAGASSPGSSDDPPSSPGPDTVVAPLVFGGFDVDDEEPPPSRGSSPGSVAEGGFMTADRSPRRLRLEEAVLAL